MVPHVRRGFDQHRKLSRRTHRGINGRVDRSSDRLTSLTSCTMSTVQQLSKQGSTGTTRERPMRLFSGQPVNGASTKISSELRFTPRARGSLAGSAIVVTGPPWLVLAATMDAIATGYCKFVARTFSPPASQPTAERSPWLGTVRRSTLTTP